MENALSRPTLIVVCGWSLSGKTTIAKILARELGVRHVDLEENVRIPIFGIPKLDFESSEFKQWDQYSMRGSYTILIEIAKIFLEGKQSLIMSANFKGEGQLKLFQITERYRGDLRFIRCLPKEDSEEEIQRRISERIQTNHPGVRTITWYNATKRRTLEDPCLLPHLELDTSSSRSPEECAAEAIHYILGT